MCIYVYVYTYTYIYIYIYIYTQEQSTRLPFARSSLAAPAPAVGALAGSQSWAFGRGLLNEPQTNSTDFIAISAIARNSCPAASRW